jgi:hypothetical protein
MAIAYDNSASGTTGFGATSLTYSLTVGSGSDRYLVVFANSVQSDGTLTATYNGVSMTQLAQWTNDQDNLSSNSMKQYLFGLANPASGANNVVISGGSGSGRLGSAASSYTGVNSTGQPDSTASKSNQNSSLSPASVDTTTVADNCWTVGAIFMGGSNPPVLSNSASTIRSQITVGTGATAGQLAIFDSNGVKTPAGVFTSSIAFTSLANHWGMGVASLKPVAVASNNAGFFTLV